MSVCLPPLGHCLRLVLVYRSFCPFHFLHTDKSDKSDAEGGGPHQPAPAVDAPRPQMFGFGRHMCPGRELAKLEIILFLQNFLRTFDYRLIEGQVCAPLPLSFLVASFHQQHQQDCRSPIRATDGDNEKQTETASDTSPNPGPQNVAHFCLARAGF